MEESAIRMVAQLIGLSKIVVKLSKRYYGGISKTFYLRNLDKNSFVKIDFANEGEDKDYHYYYFNNIPDLDLGDTYQVVDAYGLAKILTYTKLVQMDDFDTHFYYDKDDLGATYAPGCTEFKIWAPTAIKVMVRIKKGNAFNAWEMERTAKGVFYVRVPGNFDGCEYNYLIKHDENWIESVDPYALSSTANGRSSVVINQKRLIENLGHHFLDRGIERQDAIIYEASVRDFTMSPTINCKNRGKFIGFVERGLKTLQNRSAGLDYLIELGITHVQLLPIFDFATVDENHPEVLYNWGYDPAQYGLPEGSYVTDPNDGYKRIIECQTMIKKLHQARIRVVMDVVYNHVYDINDSAFEKTVPGYFFRKNENGSLSNGSWCGNDLNTTARMCRKYIVDMCMRWQRLYGVDGFRFDLMGIIDVTTLNLIDQKCRKRDENFIMYGEGWDMDTALPVSKKGTQFNHSLMPNISFFNDDFRDCIKGGSAANELANKGYLAGNMYNAEISLNYLININRYTTINQSVNYIECHDNATTFDKLQVSNGEENDMTRLKRQLLMNEFVLVAQGIPFIHAGQEFYRQKMGFNNTYNSPDSINALDWNRKDHFLDDIETIKKLIRLRKENKCFKYNTREEIDAFIELKCINYNMLVYTLRQDQGHYDKIVIYINPSYNSYRVVNEDDVEFIVGDECKEGVIGPLSFTVVGYVAK